MSDAETMKCRECGKAFEPKTEWHKDCSPECHNKYRKKVYKMMKEALKREQASESKNTMS